MTSMIISSTVTSPENIECIIGIVLKAKSSSPPLNHISAHTHIWDVTQENVINPEMWKCVCTKNAKYYIYKIMLQCSD